MSGWELHGPMIAPNLGPILQRGMHRLLDNRLVVTYQSELHHCMFESEYLALQTSTSQCPPEMHATLTGVRASFFQAHIMPIGESLLRVVTD